jgi:SAM-dependent methyltransferase
MNEKTISLADPVGSSTLQVIARAGRFNQWMYSEFKSELKGEILEAGSGIGNISSLVIGDGMSITLSDNNIEYCEWLRENFRESSNLKDVLQIDLAHPDFPSAYSTLKEKFDSVFLLNVLEHLPDDHSAIANCYYLMRPGGNLVVLVPAHQWLFCSLDKELGHCRRYSRKTLRAVVEDENFSVKEIHHFNFLGICGWFLSGKIFQSKKLGGGEMGLFNRIVPVARLLDKITFKKIGLSVIIIATKR